MNFLFEQLETERLLIRVAKPGDGALFNQAIDESLPSLAPWLSWVSPPPTIEQSELTCARAFARFLLNEDLMVFFFSRSSGDLVGGGGLHNANWKLRQFAVSYWGRTHYGGAGLITEGVRALVEHAQSVLRATRIYLAADESNTSSWRLAERVGFELEGTLRNERLNRQGQLINTRLYSKVGLQMIDRAAS